MGNFKNKAFCASTLSFRVLNVKLPHKYYSLLIIYQEVLSILNAGDTVCCTWTSLAFQSSLLFSRHESFQIFFKTSETWDLSPDIKVVTPVLGEVCRSKRPICHKTQSLAFFLPFKRSLGSPLPSIIPNLTRLIIFRREMDGVCVFIAATVLVIYPGKWTYHVQNWKEFSYFFCFFW